MVSKKMVNDQLKKIGFKRNGWGQAEVAELPNIILPDEEIYECVNGIYDGGFALLVATNIRLILVDKKPLNYLTVEDLRFDMINEMDYNHRLFGAQISISSGSKNLRFRSYNQPRLRKLIGHIQHRIAESKKKQNTNQEDQIQHLQDINKQLQNYMIAQQQYQQQIQQSIEAKAENKSTPEPPKPSHELADFLYAQSLLAQHQHMHSSETTEITKEPNTEVVKANIEEPKFVAKEDNPTLLTNQNDLEDIYDEGMKEVFSSSAIVSDEQPKTTTHKSLPSIHTPKISISTPLVINPIQIAYSKLHWALKTRKNMNEENSSNTVSSTVPTTYTINP